LVFALVTPVFGNYIAEFTSLETGVFEFTEELGKATTIWIGGFFGLVYTLIFAVEEFFIYILRFGEATEWNMSGFGQFIGYRIVCIIYHLGLFGIQWGGYNFVRDFPKRSQRVYGRILFFALAVVCHLVYNEIFASMILKTFFN